MGKIFINSKLGFFSLRGQGIIFNFLKNLGGGKKTFIWVEVKNFFFFCLVLFLGKNASDLFHFFNLRGG